MTEPETCEIVQVREDGVLVLRRGGADRLARLHGVNVPYPPPSLYFEILSRLAAAGRALHCQVVAEEALASVRLSYLAWQDKSGDVWKDVAAMLLAQGVVTTAPGAFPGREEYEREEESARRQAIGIWGKRPS